MTSQLISAVIDGRALLTTWPQSIETLWIMLWGGVGSLIIMNIRHNTMAPNENHPASPHARRKLLLALLATELGLLGICWLLLAKSNVWVPWAMSAIAPIVVVSSHPIAHQLSAVFNPNKADKTA